MIGTERFCVEQSGDVTIVRIVDTWSFDVGQLRPDSSRILSTSSHISSRASCLWI